MQTPFKYPINILENEINVVEHNIDSFFKIVNDDKLIDNYPGVYIFYNSSSMYIGESVHPFRRLKEHYYSNRLEPNDNILVFKSAQFHKSAIYDIETQLMDLTLSEGKIRLRNSTLNQNNYLYFLKEIYQPVLKDIWKELQKRKLTSNSIDEIMQTNRFKLSPYKALNSSQQEAISSIIKDKIGNTPILIEGKPGTGKSILASKMFIELSKKYNVVLTSGTHNTVNAFKEALKFEIKKLKTNSKILKTSQLFGKYKNEEFDAIIVDEAHRLLRKKGKGHGMKYKHVNEESDELAMILNRFKKVFIFYDENQIVHAGDLNINKYKNKFKIYKLNQQMRNANNDAYMLWIVNILSQNPIPIKRKELKNYEMKIYDSFSEMYHALKSKSKTSNSTILMSGYTRKWVSAKDPSKYDFNIDGIKLKWNKKNNNKWAWSKAAKNLQEVAYYNTIQGFDVEHSGVIIGKDLGYKNGKLFIRHKYVFGQNEVPFKNDPLYDEKLLQWILNRYKVLLTRAIKSVHIYFDDKNVEKYFEKYIIE